MAFNNIYKRKIWIELDIRVDILQSRRKYSRARLKRDDTRAETTFGLSTKRTSPFKLAGGLVQSTTGSRGVRISSSNGSNAGYYTMF